MIKIYFELAKQKVIDYVKTSWNSDSIFDKGKVIFIGIVLFFVLWKIIYNLFV